MYVLGLSSPAVCTVGTEGFSRYEPVPLGMRGRASVHGRIASAVATLGLLASLLAAPAAIAHHAGAVTPMATSVDETITLPENNWTAYRTQLRGQSDRVLYDLRVVEGTGIDLYVLPEDGFAMYSQDPVYFFYSYREFENSTAIQGWFRGVQGENLYFVVDNVELRGARPTGSVTVHVSLAHELESTVPAWFWVVLAGLAASVVAVPTALVLKHRRQRASALAAPPLLAVGTVDQPPPPPPPAG